MTDIQRFEAHETGMLFAEDGGWVRHADHEAALTAEQERADALVAAAYEDAAQIVIDRADRGGGMVEYIASRDAAAILDRISADARAALDRLIAEAERRGARKAALGELQRLGQEIEGDDQ